MKTNVKLTTFGIALVALLALCLSLIYIAPTKSFDRADAATTLTPEKITQMEGWTDTWTDYFISSMNGDTVEEKEAAYAALRLSDLNVEGNGTQSEPYIITTVEQMTLIGYHVNNKIKTGTSTSLPAYRNSYFKLNGNLDFSGHKWVPIGALLAADASFWDQYNSFRGNFDFGNNTISNVYVDWNYDVAGLFGKTGEVTMKNLTLDNCYLNTVGSYGGILVGNCDKAGIFENITVQNSKVNAPAVNKSYYGMIVGVNNSGTISNCVVKNSEIYGNNEVGSIVGRMSSTTVSNCTTSIDVKGNTTVGGIAGLLNVGVITDCINNGKLVHAKAGTVGGIVGNNSGGTVSNCVNNSEVLAQSIAEDGSMVFVNANSNVGGIAGYIHSNQQYTETKVLDCVNTGKVNGHQSVGGIIGYALCTSQFKDSIVENNKNTAEIVGNYRVGGIVGVTDSYHTSSYTQDDGTVVNYDDSYRNYVRKNQNLGKIVSNVMGVGGIIGEMRVGTVLSECANLGDIYSVSLETPNAEMWAKYGCGGIVGIVEISRYKQNGLTEYTTITDCYNTGNIYGNVNYIAGVIGRLNIGFQNLEGINAFTMQNVYSTGEFKGNFLGQTSTSYKRASIVNLRYNNATYANNTISLSNIFALKNVINIDRNIPTELKMYDTENIYSEASSLRLSKLRLYTADEFTQNGIYSGFDFSNEGEWGYNTAYNGSLPYLRSISQISITVHTPQNGPEYTLYGFEGSPISLADGEPAPYLCRTLVSYNTSADGSGTSYALDAQVNLTGKSLDLYAIYEEDDVRIYSISFVNSVDGLTLNGSPYTDVVRYNSVTRKIVDAQGTEIALKVDAGNENFISWSVFNSTQDTRYQALDTSQFGDPFDAVNLFNYIFDSGNLANYILDDPSGNSLGIINLTSTTTMVATFYVQKNNDSFGEVYVSNIQVQGQMNVIQNSSYVIEISANKYYIPVSVTIYNKAAYDTNPSVEPLAYKALSENDFSINFDTTAITQYLIIAEFAEKQYTVKFEAADKFNNANPEITGTDILSQKSANIYVNQLMNAVYVRDKVGWRFIEWRVKNVNSQWDVVPAQGKYINDLIITKEFLDKYLKEGDNTVTIYGCFIKQYLVEVDVQKNAQNLTNGRFIVLYGTQDITDQYLTDGVFRAYFDDGSVLKITAIADFSYQLAGFDNVDVGLEVQGNELSLTVTENRDIIIRFELFAYDINYKPVNSNNGIERDYLNDTRLYINDAPVTSFRKDDTFGSIYTDVSDIAGKHRFVGYKIVNSQTNTAEDLPANMFTAPINDEFINKYVQNNSITIMILYVRQYEVNVNIHQSSDGMGTFNIAILDQNGTQVELLENQTSFSRYIDVRNKISVTAVDKRGYKFDQFMPKNRDLENPEIMEVRVSNDVSVLLYFVPEILGLKINTDGATGGKISINSTNTPLTDAGILNVGIGDRISISFSPSLGMDVKNFEINGVKIAELSDAEVMGTTVTLNVTENFLNSLGNELVLNVSVSTGLATTYLVIIIVAPVVLVAILVLIIISMINSRKLKIRIKNELESDLKSKVKFDSSSFIKDLKEGKAVGQITDEDVKEEIKKRKGKK